jgi:hypothetical protein
MPIRASVAVRAWGKSLSITLGVAAAAAAAQLGIAYGFAILLWAKDFTERSGAAWASNLTWVCWLAATAVVIGAIVGGRVTEAAALPQNLLTHAAVIVSSAVGALVTVPLVAVPARYAQLAGDMSPAYTAARIAVLGVVIGAVVSVGVLLGRPLAWNIVAINSWLWLLALGSVLVGLRSGTVPETVRLGIWGDASGWLAVVVPLLLVAFGIGAGLAYLAKRQGANRVAVAVCGTPGPVLIAVAYLIAGPGSRPETGSHLVPYLAAPYTVLAGLLGSLLVAAIERPEPEPETAGNGGEVVTAASPAGRPATPDPRRPDDPRRHGCLGAGRIRPGTARHHHVGHHDPGRHSGQPGNRCGHTGGHLGLHGVQAVLAWALLVRTQLVPASAVPGHSGAAGRGSGARRRPDARCRALVSP